MDAAISALATRQDGRVTRRQLIAMGVAEHAIESRLGNGLLIATRRGVYAVGHGSQTPTSREREALLAVGSDALVSHLAAAGDWGFRGRPVVIDITCPRRVSPQTGIRIHRRAIDPAERRLLHGLPLTSPAQTLFDLGTMLGADALLRAANEAFVLKLLALEDLYAALARNRRRRGAAAFRRLLAGLDPYGHEVRSPLETRLNAFLRARGFPPWESNVPLRVAGETIRPDVLWRQERVIVEADGRDPHLAPLTFDSDRRRDRRLRVEGWDPVRVTSRDLEHRPDELDADLRSLLRRAA